MKQPITALLVLTMALSLAACVQEKPPETEPQFILTEAPTEIPTTLAPTEPPSTIPAATPTVPSTEAVEETEPQCVTGVIANTASVNVREGPATFTKIVKKLKEGDPITVYETTKLDGSTWCRTDDGWVAMWYVKLDSPLPESDPAEGDPGIVYHTGTLNVRKEPSVHSEKVAELKRSDRVHVREIQKAEGKTWGRIEEGWVSMEYIQLSTDTNDQKRPVHEEVPMGAQTPQWRDPITGLCRDHNFVLTSTVPETTEEVQTYLCACGYTTESESQMLAHGAAYAGTDQQDAHPSYQVITNTYVYAGYEIWTCTVCGDVRQIFP